MQNTDTVLVIRPVLRAGNHAFDHIPVEVPRATAEDQLSRLDAQRHTTWRGVRYATIEEENAFYGTEEEIIKEPVLEKAPETTIATATAEKTKTIRKTKGE